MLKIADLELFLTWLKVHVNVYYSLLLIFGTHSYLNLDEMLLVLGYRCSVTVSTNTADYLDVLWVKIWKAHTAVMDILLLTKAHILRFSNLQAVGTAEIS